MSARQASLVDALINGRYRVDAVVRRSTEAVIYDATHRNGVRAWIKVPTKPEYAKGIVLEGTLANAVGSAMKVRDDGETDGMPYLVLDPVEGSTIAARMERAGGKLPTAEVVSVGRALAEVVAAMHETGYVSAAMQEGLLEGNGGLEFDSVLVSPTGDVALLALDHAATASESGTAADLQRLGAMLYRMVAGEERTPMSVPLEMLRLVPRDVAAAIDDAFTGSIRSARELASVLAGKEVRKRKARGPALLVPTKIETPMTPMAVEVPKVTESSVITYLKSSDDAEVARAQAKPAGGPREVMSPLTREFELPRLVQATVASGPSSAKRAAKKSRRAWVPMLAIGLPVLAGVAALTAVLTRPDAPMPAPKAMLAKADVPAPEPKAAAVRPEPEAAPVEGADVPVVEDLELDELPGATGAPPIDPAPGSPVTEAAVLEPTATTAVLRTEKAPGGRRVFVDGKVVGQTPLAVRIPCGERSVQIGTHGAPVKVDVACGEIRTLRFESSGKIALE